jgi:hypothetical protein
MWLGENNRKNENTGRKRALYIRNLGMAMDENALKSVRPAGCDWSSLEARVEALESRFEDVEAVLASLCGSSRKSRLWLKYLRKFYWRWLETKLKVTDAGCHQRNT